MRSPAALHYEWVLYQLRYVGRAANPQLRVP